MKYVPTVKPAAARLSAAFRCGLIEASLRKVVLGVDADVIRGFSLRPH